MNLDVVAPGFPDKAGGWWPIFIEILGLKDAEKLIHIGVDSYGSVDIQ